MPLPKIRVAPFLELLSCYPEIICDVVWIFVENWENRSISIKLSAQPALKCTSIEKTPFNPGLSTLVLIGVQLYRDSKGRCLASLLIWRWWNLNLDVLPRSREALVDFANLTHAQSGWVDRLEDKNNETNRQSAD